MLRNGSCTTLPYVKVALSATYAEMVLLRHMPKDRILTYMYVYMYLCLGVKTKDVAAGVTADRHTNAVANTFEMVRSVGVRV